MAYTRIANMLNKPTPYAVVIAGPTELLNYFKTIGVNTISNKLRAKFSVIAIKKIRKENLDVILRLGFNIFRGDIFKVVKCGICFFIMLIIW